MRTQRRCLFLLELAIFLEFCDHLTARGWNEPMGHSQEDQKSKARAHPTSRHLVIRGHFPYYLTMLNKAFQLLVTKVTSMSPFWTLWAMASWFGLTQLNSMLFSDCSPQAVWFIFLPVTFQGQEEELSLYMWLKLINGVNQLYSKQVW